MRENLVKQYLEEIGLINLENFVDYGFFDNKEWEIYKLKDNTFLYINYEILDDMGIGFAYCCEISCSSLKYNIKSFLYSKSFNSVKKGEWNNFNQELSDKILSNAMMRI